MSRPSHSRRRWWPVAVLGAAVSAILVPAPERAPVAAWTAGEQVGLSPWISPPPSLSTSGDFATDAFSDPWDFSNAEDVIPINGVGTGVTDGVALGGGVLTVTTRNASEIRLLMKWPKVLPWGRDGWANPIDSGRYTQVTMRVYADSALSMAIRYQDVNENWGVIPFTLPAGWSTQHFDLLDPSIYPFPGSQGPWAGPIVRFELFRGGSMLGGNPPVNVQLDWVRLHRAGASQTPPGGMPVPRVLTPNIEGGADYATVERGNPWDFAGADDIGETNHLTNLRIENGDLAGTTVSNDGFVGLPLGPELNTDRYRRMTIEACYDGAFDLSDTAGGGMVGRVAWMPTGSGMWTETQDFVVFPGCHRMTLDMATNGPAALHDENSAQITGWRGMRPGAIRFDLNEDRGWRNFTLREVKLADDAAFSTSYPIQFTDAAGVGGTVADIYVTTNRGAFDGTRIAQDVPVGAGVNTFNWNGTTSGGQPMPNATYWVYIVMRSGSNVGTGYATGPLRLERPVAPGASFFVPVSPARLLDTRTGQGGNLVPLGQQVFTELDVTGVGGVPETGVTAVVMNVTVDGPTAPGFLTVWPSGEARPGVSNLNFLPGQTVPNLVTVKTGANGRVNVFNSTGATSVVADVVGYYTSTPPANGGRFTPLTPARVLDTRDGTGRGGLAAPVSGGQWIDVQVTDTAGVPPSGVTAVALNVTVDQPTTSGFITTWPSGEAMPTASTHNFVPGLTVANLVLAKVGANGRVSLFNSSGATHLIADVIGYFSSSGGTFVPVAPERLVDSRDGTGGVLGQVSAGGSFAVTLADGSPVPPSATAVIVNITAVGSSLPSYLTAWPSGAARPNASTMNPRPGVPVPNQAYLKLGPGGRLDVFNFAGSTDVIVDVFGYVT